MWNVFKVNKKDTRTTQRRRSGVFTVNIEHTPCSSVSIVNFEHVIAGWLVANKKTIEFFPWNFSKKN